MEKCRHIIFFDLLSNIICRSAACILCRSSSKGPGNDLQHSPRTFAGPGTVLPNDCDKDIVAVYVKKHTVQRCAITIKKNNMKLAVIEIAQLNTKAERRPVCEKYGLTQQQLKTIVDDYNQGKCKVENGFIEVDPPTGGMRESGNTPQTAGKSKPEERKDLPASARGGWYYEKDGPSRERFGETDREMPKEVVYMACFKLLVSIFREVVEIVRVFYNNKK